MLTSRSTGHGTSRLVRLLGFLERDPTNPSLLADAIDAAVDERDYECADDLLDRYAGLQPLPGRLVAVKALVAMYRGRTEDAIALFESLLDAGEPLHAMDRFNLAWAYATAGRHTDALAFLDDEALAASPHASRLKVRTLHHLGRYEDALAFGRRLAGESSDDAALMGALATLALDAEQEDEAARYASLAVGDSDGLATLGILALGGQDIDGAMRLFDRALGGRANNPRAWIGKGLALLGEDRAREAAIAIDRGADLFGDHLGSWIAAGWAYFVAGDIATARLRFEHALAIDPNFGEGHGALAVLDIAEGHFEAGRRRSEKALRLDRGGFGGQLASVLLLEIAGKAGVADAIRTRALATPIGASGRTIAQALAALALRRT